MDDLTKGRGALPGFGAVIPGPGGLPDFGAVFLRSGAITYTLTVLFNVPGIYTD